MFHPETGKQPHQSLTDPAKSDDTQRPITQFSPHVLASLVPNVINSEDMMPGADTLVGGNGDDTIFGDDGLVFTPIETGFTTIDNELLGLSASLMSMLGDFDALSFAKAALDRANTSYGTTTITLGGDNIDAGAGNDVVFGDAGRLILPQSSTLEANGGSLQAAALAFHAQLQDLQTVVADMALVVHETTHGLINAFATATGFTSPSNYVAAGNTTTWKMRDTRNNWIPRLNSVTQNWKSP